MMEDVNVTSAKLSWRRTLLIQVALCLALYAAFHIGTPQPPASSGVARLVREPTDLFFISVRGGARTPREQSQLLQQMEKVAKIYRAKFVVNIAELGDLDPLLQNATLHFPSEIPWYTTTAISGHMNGYFFKQIELPHEQTLDIIAVDTGSLQVLFSEEQLNKNGSNNLHWLQQILATSTSNWRIVVGFDPLIICNDKETTGMIKFNKPFHDIFLAAGVDAYLSKQGCAGYFYHNEGILYMGNPGPADKLNRGLLINMNPDDLSEMQNGFLLHRVSPLEIESFFIDSAGKIALKSMIHHRGRGAI